MPFLHKPPTISSIFTRLFGSFAGPNPATMSAAKTRAQSLINDNAVVVFSKSYCPYCDSSKKLLDSLNAKYTTLELDLEGESFSFAFRIASLILSNRSN